MRSLSCWISAPVTLYHLVVQNKSLCATCTHILLRPLLSIKSNNHLAVWLLNSQVITNKFFLIRWPRGKTLGEISPTCPDGWISAATAANLYEKVSVSASCWCRHARAVSTRACVRGNSTRVPLFKHLHCTGRSHGPARTMTRLFRGPPPHIPCNRLCNSTDTNYSTMWGCWMSHGAWTHLC